MPAIQCMHRPCPLGWCLPCLTGRRRAIRTTQAQAHYHCRGKVPYYTSCYATFPLSAERKSGITGITVRPFSITKHRLLERRSPECRRVHHWEQPGVEPRESLFSTGKVPYCTSYATLPLCAWRKSGIPGTVRHFSCTKKTATTPPAALAADWPAVAQQPPPAQLGLYKTLSHSKALLWESIICLLSPPPAKPTRL